MVINFAAADNVAMLAISSDTVMGARAAALVVVVGVVAARVSRIASARAGAMSWTCAMMATAAKRAQAHAPFWLEKSGRSGIGLRRGIEVMEPKFMFTVMRNYRRDLVEPRKRACRIFSGAPAKPWPRR